MGNIKTAEAEYRGGMRFDGYRISDWSQSAAMVLRTASARRGAHVGPNGNSRADASS